MAPKQWFYLYTDSTKGRVAAFAAIIAVTVILIHFFSGPPPLSELTVLEGRIEQLRVESSVKSSYAVWLTIRDQKQGLIEAQYFVNKGDGAGDSLKSLNGQQVKAWVERDFIPTVYQLDADDRRIIDYGIRRDQLTGSPMAVAIYSLVATTVFLALTLGLLKDRRARDQNGVSTSDAA